MSKYLSFRESLEVSHPRGKLVYEPHAVLAPVTTLKNGRFVTESEFQVINREETDKGLSCFDFSISTILALGNDPSNSPVVRVNHSSLELERILSRELGSVDFDTVFEQIPGVVEPDPVVKSDLEVES